MSGFTRIDRLRHDVAAVVRSVDPGSALRWLGAMIVRSPEIVRTGGLAAADRAIGHRLVRIKLPSGQVALIPGSAFGSARELYCRDVYLRRGLEVRPGTWVVDLGANHGMFTNLAAVQGARVVAVEAQPGFVAEILGLARRNRVLDRVQVVTAMIGPNRNDIGLVGVLADENEWLNASHSDGAEVDTLGMNALLERFNIDRVSLLKIDIEGGEFSLLDPSDDLGWLQRVDQITMEVHPTFGKVTLLVERFFAAGFTVEATHNDGYDVTPDDPSVAYLYARRASSASTV